MSRLMLAVAVPLDLSSSSSPVCGDLILEVSIVNGILTAKTAFGYHTVEDDEFVRIAEEAQYIMISAARPGLIPFLKYVPEWIVFLATSAREGREFVEGLRTNLTHGLENDSVKARSDPGEEEQLIKKASTLIYISGADTILVSVLNFFLAMLYAPDVQKKEYEELRG
ncbi:uncharacterized protein BT62DRAFT_919865 [Guyanagaster necrorhizus]|uniref:Uncharacterized protein n=1 Tax=Guyanagaster necrorhizus TaxID=856835 RepID=A0A9P7VUC0_9AGAR|nr:uncharacterized protein BT62DRAFT_919865 [Guyanagaster necrorhizus MCA 3950]KAG7446610.1 hypothetical protein BT62DRAFT_919865 [Guyanagaster necrorhizus MCA 3950]